MNSQKKIFSRGTVKEKISLLRRRGKEIAFTNGCFDILHFGHVHYLEKAARQDRVLIVGLNSDASVRRIKGPSRPVNDQRHRARVLAALECVDFVTIFPESTPLALIKFLKPDVLVKGADWKGKEIVGEDIVKQRGGKVELVAYLPKFSTTKLIRKMANKQ